MLKRVTITNYRGESVRYEIKEAMANISEDPDWTSPETAGLLITEIDGLGPAKANINLTELTSTDGGFFNSARLSSRNIVISGRFMHADSIEEARLLSYKFFPIKSKVTIKVETDNRTGVTTGYVESNEPVIFSKECETQVSIICESPFFDGEKIEEALFYDTEKQITYDGDADNGMLIALGLGTSASPVDSCSVDLFEITKDDGTFKFDTSKMSGTVPNTSPTNLSRKQASFVFGNSGTTFKSKFLSKLPEEFDLTYSVFFEGETHIFATHHSPDATYHFKIDGTTKKLVQLEIIDYSTPFRFLVSWQSDPTDPDSAYAIYGVAQNGSNDIVKYSPSQNKFIVESYSGNTFPYINACKAVVYGGLIHMFITNDAGSTAQTVNYHYTYDPINSLLSWVEGPEATGDFGTIFPSYTYSSSPYFTFENAQLVVYDNKIYVLGGNDTFQNQVAIYDPNNSHIWSAYPNMLTISSLAIKGVSQLNNDVYLILENDSTTSYLYKYNGGGNCRLIGEVPVYNMTDAGTPTFGADGDYLYILGNNTAGTFSENANNVKFIEGDIVAINSYKGQKSIRLYRDNNEYNILNVMTKDSSWLTFHNGVNTFKYVALNDYEQLNVVVSTNKLYEGV